MQLLPILVSTGSIMVSLLFLLTEDRIWPYAGCCKLPVDRNQLTAMPPDASEDSTQFQCDAKSIFLKWEKLRPLYNLILLVTLAVALESTRQTLLFRLRDPGIILAWMFAAIGANICYFAAPITESYLCWLGMKGTWITALLFMAGVLVSIPIVDLLRKS